ncbi:membrane associated ring finger 1,8 [uncultured Mediterranean phage]|nr:membrane associated ring finger 1,8 [uncultured Mediterranean phage]
MSSTSEYTVPTECRICFSSSPSQGQLITPCDCSGSLQYVHENCLSHWRTIEEDRRPRATCEVCQGPYNTAIVPDLIRSQGGETPLSQWRVHVEVIPPALVDPAFCTNSACLGLALMALVPVASFIYYMDQSMGAPSLYITMLGNANVSIKNRLRNDGTAAILYYFYYTSLLEMIIYLAGMFAFVSTRIDNQRRYWNKASCVYIGFILASLDFIPTYGVYAITNDWTRYLEIIPFVTVFNIFMIRKHALIHNRVVENMSLG